MKWTKLGKIFDPSTFELPAGCHSYAQAPQALVFDSFVRIYFSARSLDERNGGFLSHVAFADFSVDFSKILAVSRHTVISLGNRGCFDEHGIFPMNVLRVGDAIYGYTSGVNRRVSVPVDSAIGLAVSQDGGYTFHRAGPGPILSASPKEPCLVADPFVMFEGGVFHMWHIFGQGWRKEHDSPSPDRIYKIGHATSTDGVNWSREDGRKLVADRLGPDECQALPTVFGFPDGYHMLFCYRHRHDFRLNKNRAYRIGHAYSSDLVNWTRNDLDFTIEVSEEGWDSEMLCYPHVFKCNGKYYLLYNGNHFGREGFGLAVLEQ